MFEEGNKSASLLGGSIWGMSRSAALELDSTSLQIICVDTDLGFGMRDGFVKVVQELIRKGEVLDNEISYRGQGNTRFVRILRPSMNPLLEDVELTLESRGSLESLVVSLLKGHGGSSVHSGCIEVSVHAVGLDFKDV